MLSTPRTSGASAAHHRSEHGPIDRLVGWRAYAAEYIDLIGLSGVAGAGGELEAIIVDRKVDKMHLPRVGDEFWWRRRT